MPSRWINMRGDHVTLAIFIVERSSLQISRIRSKNCSIGYASKNRIWRNREFKNKRKTTTWSSVRLENERVKTYYTFFWKVRSEKVSTFSSNKIFRSRKNEISSWLLLLMQLFKRSALQSMLETPKSGNSWKLWDKRYKFYWKWELNEIVSGGWSSESKPKNSIIQSHTWWENSSWNRKGLLYF